MDELWALGPDVIPCLAAEARRRDSPLSKSYLGLWWKLPPVLRRYLPERIDRVELRRTAMRAIAEFGPLAARRAAPQVIAGLGEGDDQSRHHAQQCVRWLLPASVSALGTLERGLSGASTDGSISRSLSVLKSLDGSVLAKMPRVVPLLTNHLRDAGHVYGAALVLSRFGSNAQAALPALVQTLDMGAAGVFTDTETARTQLAAAYSDPLGRHMAEVQEDDKQMNHNRAMAALALGRIGTATPEVRAALVRGWNAPDAWVRRNAAEAVALLGSSMTNDLPGLLAGLMDHDNAALDKKLLAIGKIGPEARCALVTLRKLTQASRLRSLVADPEAEVAGWTIEDLALSAKMAIGRIDPQEARPFLPDIVKKIGYWWESVEFLVELCPLSNDVVRAVEPRLGQTETHWQSIAAYIILCHDNRHAKALEVLRQNESAGELNERLLAGRLLFQSLGETNGMCSLIAEAVKAPESFIGQSACQIAEELGVAALPALPAFKVALWHKDRFVRERAGMLVIKLAPEEIPVNEAK